MAENRIGLERGILRFLAEANDWREALKHLLSDRRLVTALANELAGCPNYGYCPRKSGLNNAFDKLIDTVRLPIISPPSKFRGRAQEDTFLSQTRRGLKDLDDSDLGDFKDFADRGWGELETLTKIVVRFYRHLFGERGDVVDAFLDASQASGLIQRLDRMRGIQKKLNLLNKDRSSYVYQRERTDCQWRLNRPTPFGDFLNGTVEVDLCRAPSRWSIRWRETLVKYDQSKKNVDGVTSVSRLNYYKANIDFYRHFFAHANRQEWIYTGKEMVSKSFEAAAEIIQRILALNLCPDMIVPIAIGQDGFRRRIAFFVHEKDLGNNGSYSRRDIRLMFLGGEQFIEPNCFYFCPYPAKSGMFEPLLVPADDILMGV